MISREKCSQKAPACAKKPVPWGRNILQVQQHIGPENVAARFHRQIAVIPVHGSFDGNKADALSVMLGRIDKSRILKYLGHLAPEDMQRLDYALKNSLALNPLGSIRKLKPIIRSTAAYAPPEVVDGKPPIYPYTPIKSSFEDAGSVEEMMLYTELQSAVHAMIQRLEYSFTFNPSLLTIPKRKQQVSEILAEAEKYIWRIREEMQCD